MSGEKRKFDDLIDPDYPQNAKLMRKTVAEQPQQLTRDERLSRIRAIVKREFQRELSAKEQEILEIDSRITLARKLLHRVRYAVVYNYYHKKGLELPDLQAQNCVESLNSKSTAPPANERDQRAVHPALKSILGKKTVDYDEILKARPTRKAAKTAKTSIKEKLRTKREEKQLQRAMNGAINTVICHDDPPKVPRHVEPNKVEKDIPQLNAARGGNQTKHLIAVGNTSKYVGDEKFANGVTHKWLVYVKAKSSIPIEKLLSKVRFFLHPSYRPNDIVDVSEPPFQISRRGWGEFPVRLQLFFVPSIQQKPLQLVHNLALDKSLTGLQTMGAETLVEMWLRTDHIQPSPDKNRHTIAYNDNQTTEDENSQDSDDAIDHVDDKLMEFLTRIENQTSKSLCEDGERIEPTISSKTDMVDVKTPVNTKEEFFDFNKITTSSSKSEAFSEIFEGSEMSYDEKTESDVHLSNNTDLATVKHEAVRAPQSTVVRMDFPSKTIKNNNMKTIETTAKTKHAIEETLVRLSQQSNHRPNLIQSAVNDDRNLLQIKLNSPSCSQSKIQNTTITPSLSTRTLNIISKVPHLVKTVQLIDRNSVKPTTVAVAANPTANKSVTLVKRLVKCVDKQGNVKYVEMFVKPASSQSSPTILSTQPTGVVQKAVLITKSNSHVQDTPKTPIIYKITPQNSTTSTIKPTSTIQQLKYIAPMLPAKSTSPSLTPSVPSLRPPTSKENQSSVSVTKPTVQSTNKNQVLVKNGKMYIKDPLQAKIKQQTKKQESLLKPQVSLLKPIVKNDNLSNCIRNDAKSVFSHTSIATDHDYTSLIGKSPSANKVTIHRPLISNQYQKPLGGTKQKTSIVTVSSPNNSRINVIVTKLDDEEDDGGNDRMVSSYKTFDGLDVRLKNPLMPKSTALMQKPRRDYCGELEMAFIAVKFISVRQGVEFLLKSLPLINALASSIDYSSSFPFVVKSQRVFDDLMTPKLKANEWLRAKYIHRILQKHKNFDTSHIWTTKEIILFARLHAYTPVIKYKIDKQQNIVNKNETIDKTLKDLVKKEIKREKYDLETLSLVHETYNWINDIRQKIKEELKLSEDVIDVDGIDDSNNLNKMLSQNDQSPMKNISGKYFYSLDRNIEQEASFVSDVCQQIGIRLRPEEITKDVYYPSTHLVLVQCLKSFLNDLLRRATASRPDVNTLSSLIEHSIQPDDIKNAILSRPQWDFLTNNGLGVARSKEQKQ